MSRRYSGISISIAASTSVAATTGTKSGSAVPASARPSSPRTHAAKRKVGCDAASLAYAPGTRLSATIAAFSSSLQRRRRAGPVSTSTRRKLCLLIGKLLGTRSV
jgi:hypothetical protein